MKIGALWIKENEKGKFMSGEIDLITSKINVVVFRNENKKEGSNHPDYEIVLSRPKKETSDTTDIQPGDVPF